MCDERNVVKMLQDPEVQVAQEVPVVRTVLQQRSQVNQEGPGVLEGQEGPVDPQPNVPENQVGRENRVVQVDLEDLVVQAAQEVRGDLEVPAVLLLPLLRSLPGRPKKRQHGVRRIAVHHQRMR